jgi:RHS repeat-associated protein
LLGSYDGRVVADGIRLVAAGAGASNLVYIHADHLGSPQKMTDASQALVWDAQFDPFGEEVSISGAATHPTRFPGQYADPETGFSYNYFRDYDPTIGRYVQSDPIGLRGGLNTYSYVDGNPLTQIDPKGLRPNSLPVHTGIPEADPIEYCNVTPLPCRLEPLGDQGVYCSYKCPGRPHSLVVRNPNYPRNCPKVWIPGESVEPAPLPQGAPIPDSEPDKRTSAEGLPDWLYPVLLILILIGLAGEAVTD